MPNLKLDLINKLKNDKYYEELEMIRLAQEPNMYYKEKIDGLSERLKNIALLNSQIDLAERYFPEQQQQPPVMEQQKEVDVKQKESSPHPGQSHAE